MRSVTWSSFALVLADHVATRCIPVAILTAEPGVPPARRSDAAPLTLVLSHQGIVYERDLGPDTEKLAPKITAYDPDSGWDEVSDDGEAD